MSELFEEILHACEPVSAATQHNLPPNQSLKYSSWKELRISRVYITHFGKWTLAFNVVSVFDLEPESKFLTSWSFFFTLYFNRCFSSMWLWEFCTDIFHNKTTQNNSSFHVNLLHEHRKFLSHIQFKIQSYGKNFRDLYEYNSFSNKTVHVKQ